MAICSLKTQLKTGMNVPEAKTQLIWTMNDGTKTDESDKFGPIFCTDFLGRSLDADGNRGDVRWNWVALNDRPR